MLLACKKTSGIPYRLKELDLNIYSLEELCYFIFNFAVLISRNFINNNRNLRPYINTICFCGG